MNVNIVHSIDFQEQVEAGQGNPIKEKWRNEIDEIKSYVAE